MVISDLGFEVLLIFTPKEGMPECLILQMKIIIPEVILKGVEKNCPLPKTRNYFKPQDLEEPLKDFINNELEIHNSKLYNKYKHHRGTNERTLRFAWTQTGEKNAGADTSLRNLLSYFGFGKGWYLMLQELGIKEEDLVRSTKKIKEKYKFDLEVYNNKIPNAQQFSEANILLKTDYLTTYSISNTRVTNCCFVNDSALLAGGFDKNLYIIKRSKNEVSPIPISNSIIRVIYPLGNGDTFLLGCDDGDIIAFQFSTMGFKKIANSESSIFCICGSNREGHLLTSERNGKVKEWEVDNLSAAMNRNESPTLHLIRKVHQHKGACFMVGYSKVKQECLSISGAGSLMHTNLLDGTTTTEQITFLPLYSIVINHQTIVIGAGSGIMFICRNNKFEEFQVHNDTVRSVVISTGNKWMVTGSKDKLVKIWNLETFISWSLFRGSEYIYEIILSEGQDELLIADGSGHLSLIAFKNNIDNISQQDMETFIKNLKTNNYA